jgi:hypothetical protein
MLEVGLSIDTLNPQTQVEQTGQKVPAARHMGGKTKEKKKTKRERSVPLRSRLLETLSKTIKLLLVHLAPNEVDKGFVGVFELHVSVSLAPPRQRPHRLGI